ncbi:hypothetical protein [Aliiroseovarius subalbicans]|uniref:hypothetical protein n=1 Tax=Aliiroseovarius subalbicans TaxID=2925840 RepID=UPI001F5994B0|nr:hypothetical protein [Aliiroseovarius subalbicans]MCI2400398.1 hypothetical protein [Aliiroseovarius subalbicans]
MKHLLMALGLMLLLVPDAQAAGKIERACLKADRRDASRQLCGCVQDVAEAMFNRSEISKIAKFFSDPHTTQELRQSDRNSDERFWKRYKEYGQAVRTYCGS